MPHDMITLDLGTEFYGFRGKIDDRIVCAATPRVEHDARIRGIVRDMIRRQGGDCATCQACIIGRLA